MGILLLAHPKHTYSKIGGLTDSESEYSSNSEAEPDDLIQYSKQVESNSTKNSKSNQDSLPNLVIYATPQGRHKIPILLDHSQRIRPSSRAPL